MLEKVLESVERMFGISITEPKVEYEEIFVLKKMLEGAGIPFEFHSYLDGYHLCYPCFGENRICSVVEHNFSYGSDSDKLEIMGLLSEAEQQEDVGDEHSVKGYMSAQEVFDRIKLNFEKEGDVFHL